MENFERADVVLDDSLQGRQRRRIAAGVSKLLENKAEFFGSGSPRHHIPRTVEVPYLIGARESSNPSSSALAEGDSLFKVKQKGGIFVRRASRFMAFPRITGEQKGINRLWAFTAARCSQDAPGVSLPVILPRLFL